jgi:transcription termination factor Rho
MAPNTEIVFSTFDESAENQIKMTEIINERAKRLVEEGKKVVILLDSITRLVRSYNYAVPSSGKVLTGGVDPVALIRPKKFFGSARNTEEGGSLTIIATCLVETGSKMDEFIFEELKGTGNAEMRLSRTISQKRIFPAVDISQSGARRTDLFVPENKLSKMRILETFLSNMDDSSEAAKLLIDRIRTSRENRDLLVNMIQPGN